MRTRYRTTRFFTYFFLFIALAEVAAYITLAVMNKLTDDMHWLELLFAFLTPTVIVVWSVILLLDIEQKILLKNLKVENSNYLGRDTYFYNATIFERLLKRVPKRHHGTNYYVMSFVPCSQDITSNITRNETMIKFNGLISNMLKEYFAAHKVYKKHDSLYCFSRGSFYVFVKGTENRINEILRDLEQSVYDIAAQNQIRVFVQPFFGITIFNKGDDIQTTCDNALLARYKSESNFELSSFYDPNLRNTASLSEAQEILDAIKNKEFVVFYQPKYSLDQRTFISSEALVRWDSPKYGFLNPGRFIDKAEKAGLIHEIDMYVFNRVCENLNEAKRRGRKMVPVSINFSLYEFFSPNFVNDIVKIIDDNGVPHDLIEIEITETTTQSNPFLSISIMKKIREAGLRVLMDDFGVGFSNFSNLRKMPIDAIKIDKSFIDLIVTDTKAREITKFLIELGRVNEIEVIAEGVDNIEQVDILRRFRLNTIQGFYYSKPLPFKEYTEFLKNNPFEKKGDFSAWF